MWFRNSIASWIWQFLLLHRRSSSLCMLLIWLTPESACCSDCILHIVGELGRGGITYVPRQKWKEGLEFLHRAPLQGDHTGPGTWFSNAVGGAYNNNYNQDMPVEFACTTYLIIIAFSRIRFRLFSVTIRQKENESWWHAPCQSPPNGDQIKSRGRLFALQSQESQVQWLSPMCEMLELGAKALYRRQVV